MQINVAMRAASKAGAHAPSPCPRLVPSASRISAPRGVAIITEAASSGRTQWSPAWRGGVAMGGPDAPAGATTTNAIPSQSPGALATTDAKASALRKLVVDGNSDGQEVQVKFCLKYRTSYGQTVKILGSHPRLGAWDLEKALPLQWSDGDRWLTTVDLPADAVYEYKYVLVDYDTQAALAWQGGGNSVLAVEEEKDVQVEDNWNNAPGAYVAANGTSLTRESKLQAWAKEMASYKHTAKTAAVELAKKNDELQSAKAQVARLKMELSLSAKSKEDMETRMVELQQENVLLKGQVAQSQMAMKSTLEEAIKLLADEMEDDDQDHHSGGSGGNSVSSSDAATNSGGSFGLNFGNWGQQRQEQPAYTHAAQAMASSSGSRGSSPRAGEQAPTMDNSLTGWRNRLEQAAVNAANAAQDARDANSGAMRNWRAMFA